MKTEQETLDSESQERENLINAYKRKIDYHQRQSDEELAQVCFWQEKLDSLTFESTTERKEG